MKISVVICAHNPRHEYLSRVLVALRAQTLSLAQWELLLIDNGSRELLAEHWDISWHPLARHISESELGLTYARLRGIEESKAELLVFVDDDNVLDSDYLEVALHIAAKYPFIGAWGGSIKGAYETTPPDWAKPFLNLLAIGVVYQDKWSNFDLGGETTPVGAGMCIRREVAQAYRARLKNSSYAITLGRRGNELTSGEDLDIAWAAYDLHLATGLFSALKLTHLIPSARLQEDYLVKLIEEIRYSEVLLLARHERAPSIADIPIWRRLLGQIKRQLTMTPRKRRFLEARLRGEQRAFALLAGT
jgi:hypothetical protein